MECTFLCKQPFSFVKVTNPFMLFLLPFYLLMMYVLVSTHLYLVQGTWLVLHHCHPHFSPQLVLILLSVVSGVEILGLGQVVF